MLMGSFRVMCVFVGERKWNGGHGSNVEQHSVVFTTSSTRINSLIRMILTEF